MTLDGWAFVHSYIRLHLFFFVQNIWAFKNMYSVCMLYKEIIEELESFIIESMTCIEKSLERLKGL